MSLRSAGAKDMQECTTRKAFAAFTVGPRASTTVTEETRGNLLRVATTFGLDAARLQAQHEDSGKSNVCPYVSCA